MSDESDKKEIDKKEYERLISTLRELVDCCNDSEKLKVKLDALTDITAAELLGIALVELRELTFSKELADVKKEWADVKIDVIKAGIDVVKNLIPVVETVARQQKTESILQFFSFMHLPPHLQSVSHHFYELAHVLVKTLSRNPERTVALRKLLECKDAAVRAAIYKDE
jgi:hypothetical protein